MRRLFQVALTLFMNNWVAGHVARYAKNRYASKHLHPLIELRTQTPFVPCK